MNNGIKKDKEDVKSENVKNDNKKPQLEFNTNQLVDKNVNQFSIGFTGKNKNDFISPNKKQENFNNYDEDEEESEMQDQTSIVNYNNINTEVINF